MRKWNFLGQCLCNILRNFRFEAGKSLNLNIISMALKLHIALQSAIDFYRLGVRATPPIARSLPSPFLCGIKALLEVVRWDSVRMPAPGVCILYELRRVNH